MVAAVVIWDERGGPARTNLVRDQGFRTHGCMSSRLAGKMEA